MYKFFFITLFLIINTGHSISLDKIESLTKEAFPSTIKWENEVVPMVKSVKLDKNNKIILEIRNKLENMRPYTLGEDNQMNREGILFLDISSMIDIVSNYSEVNGVNIKVFCLTYGNNQYKEKLFIQIDFSKDFCLRFKQNNISIYDYIKLAKNKGYWK